MNLKGSESENFFWTLVVGIALFYPLSSIAYADHRLDMTKPSEIKISSKEAVSANSFDKCVEAFFNSDLPADIEKLGLKFSPSYIYAWVVDAVFRVIPEHPSQLLMPNRRPYFDEQGWAEFMSFYEREIKPFSATARNAVVVPRLMSAPRMLKSEFIKDDNGSRIGAKLFFEVEYSFRFIQQAEREEDAISDERFSQVIISVKHNENDKTFKIDSWKVQKPIRR